MQENEAAWLVRAQRGDPEAFTHLVEIYQKQVFNLCYRMLNDPNDAEDASQETFLRAYNNMKRYDNSRPFPTWLLSIAAHYCIDQIRKRRMTIISMEELPYPDLPDVTPTPETSYTRSEDKKRVQAILEGLGPVDRAAVIMYYWYDLSYEEISQALTLTVSAVKSRLHRARRDMAQEWMNKQPQTLALERKRHESPAF